MSVTKNKKSPAKQILWVPVALAIPRNHQKLAYYQVRLQDGSEDVLLWNPGTLAFNYNASNPVVDWNSFSGEDTGWGKS